METMVSCMSMTTTTSMLVTASIYNQIDTLTARKPSCDGYNYCRYIAEII